MNRIVRFGSTKETKWDTKCFCVEKYGPRYGMEQQEIVAEEDSNRNDRKTKKLSTVSPG